jgi:hypothetical protein
VGKENGLTVFTTHENLWHQPSSEKTMERDFELIIEEYKKINMKLDLIMVIFPFKVPVLKIIHIAHWRENLFYIFRKPIPTLTAVICQWPHYHCANS